MAVIDDIILQSDDIHRMNVILTRYIDKGRVDCVLLINKSGRLLSSQSESSEYDKTALAALIAGNFASTTSIANMIGEETFQTLEQQGRRKHLHVAQIDENTILAVIFGNRTTHENVKNTSRQFSPELESLLRSFYESIENNPELNIDASLS